MKPDLHYHHTAIRTSAMVPDRSADLNYFEPTLTQQSYADECDINNIVKTNANGGIIVDPSRINESTPIWGDFGDSTDFHAHQNYMAEAMSAFHQLPAEVRAQFDNDPAKLLDFVSQEKNQEDAIALGLATRRPETPVQSLSDDEPEFIPNPARKTTKTPPKESGE